jgi:hypothetical protein
VRENHLSVVVSAKILGVLEPENAKVPLKDVVFVVLCDKIWRD